MYTCSELAVSWVVFQPYLCFSPANNVSQKQFKALASTATATAEKSWSVCVTQTRSVWSDTRCQTRYWTSWKETHTASQLTSAMAVSRSAPSAFRVAFLLSIFWRRCGRRGRCCCCCMLNAKRSAVIGWGDADTLPMDAGNCILCAL